MPNTQKREWSRRHFSLPIGHKNHKPFSTNFIEFGNYHFLVTVLVIDYFLIGFILSKIETDFKVRLLWIFIWPIMAMIFIIKEIINTFKNIKR